MSDNNMITRRSFIRNSAKSAAGLIVGASMGAYAFQKGITKGKSPNDTIGIGIIGIGIRGKQLLSSIGFVHPERMKSQKLSVDVRSGVSEEFKLPPLELRGVSDVYTGALKYGMEIAEASGSKAIAYKDYREMLENKDIDAVIIATPDHWHSTMGIDAVNAGKDVYVEKCMTHTIQEAKDLVKAIKVNKRIFQLGHQGRQSEIYKKAREVVEQGTLGDITLVQTFTNRNDPNGAWQYDIPKDASPETVDWGKFLGKAPWREFDLKRIFRWRCYWDYGTGLSGDLLTHEWDAISYVLGVGIPHSSIASGGIYYFKDGREVPDVFQVVMEYPDRNLTVCYQATLANSFRRAQLIMGSDATMDLTGGLNVFVDRESKRYAEKIKSGELKLLNPMLAYQAQTGQKIEAITSATEKWTIDKGLLYTFTPEGQMVNTTMLHFKNFFECMKSRTLTVCNEDIGFEEAITAHMATQSYLQGRKIVWDPVREEII
jgi:predicted dehydrogenase